MCASTSKWLRYQGSKFFVFGLTTAGLVFGATMEPASASPDELRSKFAKQNCTRDQFRDYYLQGEGGDPPANYSGRVFKLSQDYPDQLPPQEAYPWSSISFENGGPTDPEAYLNALLSYGLEGNVEVDFYVEDNQTRRWYGMPWMDWNTEVAADWPGTDGREFVHGLTHEFDSFPKTLGNYQDAFTDTWSGAYFNDRAGFGIGQVYCDPNSPDPSALNPDPRGVNNFANGSYIIKLLFSTVEESQLAPIKGALEWQADIYVEPNPKIRNQGPLSKFRRAVQPVRLLQIDVAVRDDRSLTGWLFGTFAFDGRLDGDNPWEKMVPLGLQWGSDPGLTYAETCGDEGACDPSKLQQQWINLDAVTELAKPPVSLDHLGYGGRLAGPVDNPQAACMACHQTAGFPFVSISPELSRLAAILEIDDAKEKSDRQDFRLGFYDNVTSGVAFSDSQLFSSDYSLQLSMSLHNFASVKCTETGESRPEICDLREAWAEAMIRYVNDIMELGTPGPGGAPKEGVVK